MLLFSKKMTSTMLLRDKLIAQILEVYVPSLSH
jgi:hypothetical protein